MRGRPPDTNSLMGGDVSTFVSKDVAKQLKAKAGKQGRTSGALARRRDFVGDRLLSEGSLTLLRVPLDDVRVRRVIRKRQSR